MCSIMQEIANHQKDKSAVLTWDGMIVQEGCPEKPKITAKGWELLVQWKDGSSSWEKLKDLKVSNLIKVAEHAAANQNCKWTSICMVGSTSTAQVESDHFKGEVKALADDSQVWHAFASFSQRSIADWCWDEDGSLAESTEQRDVKGESSLEVAWWLHSWWHMKWKEQGLRRLSRDWLPHCVQCPHDLWMEGPFCHQRAHNGSTIIHCMLKCCFMRQCMAWLFDCCIEWCWHSCMRLAECMLECTLCWEDMVWRWHWVWQRLRQSVDCHQSIVQFEVGWIFMAIILCTVLKRLGVSTDQGRPWCMDLGCSCMMTVSSIMRWHLHVWMTYFLSHTSPGKSLNQLLNCTQLSQAVTRH